MAGGYVSDAVGGGRHRDASRSPPRSSSAVGADERRRAAPVRARPARPHRRPRHPHAGHHRGGAAARAIDNLQPFAPHGWAAVGSGCGAARVGLRRLGGGGLARRRTTGDPSRDVPRATAVALVVVGTLYLALAATSLMVLGSATGSSEAPLSDLLAAGVGGEVRIVTAVVAVLLTVGAMNAYYAGGSRLGAALARDGALPAYLASGCRRR